jgi:FkbM family methyltransferase
LRQLKTRLSTWLTHSLRVLSLQAAFPSWRQKLRLLVVWLALEGRFWFGWFGERAFRVTWRGPRGDVSARLGDVSELWAVWETFVNGEYARVKALAPRVILDIGANIGIAALYFDAVCPGARIIAVEAAPRTFELLRENTRHLPNVTCVHAAVTDAVGTVTIYSGRRSLASSLTPSAGLPDAHVVPATTLERLAEDVGYGSAEFVKLDVEGAEVQVIPASAATLSAARAIAFEFHQQPTETDLWSLLATLPDFEVSRIRGDTSGRAVVDLVRR